MAQEKRNKFNEIAEFWGAQMPMNTCEEAGELIQAISKVEREAKFGEGPDSEAYNEKIKILIKEIADMQISLIALEKHYGIDVKDVNADLERKLKLHKSK